MGLILKHDCTVVFDAEGYVLGVLVKDAQNASNGLYRLEPEPLGGILKHWPMDSPYTTAPQRYSTQEMCDKIGPPPWEASNDVGQAGATGTAYDGTDRYAESQPNRVNGNPAELPTHLL